MTNGEPSFDQWAKKTHKTISEPRSGINYRNSVVSLQGV